MRDPSVRILLLALTACLAMGPGARTARAAAGDLDPSFDGDGKLTDDFRLGSENVSQVALQPDGKIVAAVARGGDFLVLRYDASGILDPTFDGDGKVFTDFGEGYEDANAVVIQPDGKIVVGGSVGCGSFALARYNPDGSLDPSFGTGGQVTTDFGGCDVISALVLQPDGKIVAAGVTYSPYSDDFALARYNPDGSLDASFGGGGKVITDFGGSDGASALALQADGKIVAVGHGGQSAALVARYRTDGSLDASFDGDGKEAILFGPYGWATDVTIQGDGKILVAGFGTYAFVFALARLNIDGSLDPTFDGDGKVTSSLAGDTRQTSVALQADGKIVVAGSNYHNYDASFAVARYDSQGALDPTFGGSGWVLTDFGRPEDVGVLCPPARSDCSEDIVSDVVIQPDGKILVAGGAGPCVPTCYVALARYEAGRADTQPPTLTASCDPSVLWPPNHELVAVGVDAAARDDQDPSPVVELISATSNEPDAGNGLGDSPGDIQTLDQTHFLLRRERQGSGDGREYTLCYRATDDAGNSTEACCVVRVPRDQSGRAELSENGLELVVFGSPAMSARGIVPGSTRVLRADAQLVIPSLLGFGDRDGDAFEDAVFAVTASDDGSPPSTGGDRASPQGQFARWETQSSGYLAALGPTSPVSVEEGSRPGRIDARVIPNPARERALVQYELPRTGRVRLSIFDLHGRELARLVDGSMPAGRHEASWTRLRGGAAQVYWYRLEALGQRVSGRFVVRD
jgi:uncharacterized delta-60 repeat protein